MFFFIPIISVIFQLLIAFIFIYFLGYFPWSFILQNFWSGVTNVFLPIIVIGGISLSFFVKNPVWVLLSILSSFLVLGILLINTGIEFITFFFIIVYLGALMMLFLFVIMLFDLQQLSKDNKATTIKINISFQILILQILVYKIGIINFKNIEFINLLPITQLFNITSIDFNTLYFFNFFYVNNTLIFKTLYTFNQIYFIIITLILLYTLIGALMVITMVKQKVKNAR